MACLVELKDVNVPSDRNLLGPAADLDIGRVCAVI